MVSPMSLLVLSDPVVACCITNHDACLLLELCGKTAPELRSVESHIPSVGIEE